MLVYCYQVTLRTLSVIIMGLRCVQCAERERESGMELLVPVGSHIDGKGCST